MITVGPHSTPGYCTLTEYCMLRIPEHNNELQQLQAVITITVIITGKCMETLTWSYWTCDTSCTRADIEDIADINVVQTCNCTAFAKGVYI